MNVFSIRQNNYVIYPPSVCGLPYWCEGKHQSAEIALKIFPSTKGKRIKSDFFHAGWKWAATEQAPRRGEAWCVGREVFEVLFTRLEGRTWAN